MDQQDVSTLCKAQDGKKQRFLEEKAKLNKEIEFTIQDIEDHIQYQHKEACECTNIMSFLISNLQCIQEDLEEWSYNDRESWLKLLSPDGICEKGLQHSERIASILKSTEAWDDEYKEFVDPVQNSLQRISKETDKEEEENNNRLDNAYDKLEFLQKQLEELEGRIPESEKKKPAFFKNQNFFDTQPQQNNPYSQSLNSAYNITQEELLGFSEVSKEIKQKLSKMVSELEIHQKQVQKCDCTSWINQLIQMIQDVPYWSQIDQAGWESTMTIMKLKCELGMQQKKQVVQVLKQTKEMLNNYPNATNSERQMSQKFGTDNDDLYTAQGMENLTENFGRNLGLNSDNINDQLKELQGKSLVDIQKMQNDILSAMQDFEQLKKQEKQNDQKISDIDRKK